MRHFAELFGEDTENGVLGLIHDLDYEMYPEQHCKTKEILARNWPEDYIHAVISHGWKICVDEPVEKMEKVCTQ